MIPDKKFYIITGDVVAYYPSIPIKKCLDIVEHLYAEWSELPLDGNYTTTSKDSLAVHSLFIQCLLIGNRDLITQFQGKYYKQRRGLAMGVADSPDLANLYGWFFERSSGILDDPNIPFYGRFIDDCLAIVYAINEAEALHMVKTKIVIEDCVIDWNVSGTHQPFLDMMLYCDEEGRLQHMPYRKARSHQERIPWTSHHPVDVKRGTFIGEMSRLATLCSLNSTYARALEQLVLLYVKRGYPEQLVQSWLKKYSTNCWAKRLSEEVKCQSELLVLKSEFNEAWNYFSAKELGSTIIEYWRNWINHAKVGNFSVTFPRFSGAVGDLGCVPNELTQLVHTPDGIEPVPDVTRLGFEKRRFMVSRKRTRNLFDLTSIWKKVVLTRMDELSSLPDLTPVPPIDNEDQSYDSDESETQGTALAKLANISFGLGQAWLNK
jgi:hypothetical protein